MEAPPPPPPPPPSSPLTKKRKPLTGAGEGAEDVQAKRVRFEAMGDNGGGGVIVDDEISIWYIPPPDATPLFEAALDAFLATCVPGRSVARCRLQPLSDRILMEAAGAFITNGVGSAFSSLLAILCAATRWWHAQGTVCRSDDGLHGDLRPWRHGGLFQPL